MTIAHPEHTMTEAIRTEVVNPPEKGGSEPFFTTGELRWRLAKTRGKRLPSPTLRWIFQCFQSVHLVEMDNLIQVVNLTEERQRILRFLGAACQKYYLLL